MTQPDMLDAIVVGGGIVGLMTARELLHLGLKVRLIDQAFAGPIRTHVGEMAHVGGDPAMTALYAHSLACWHEASARYGSDMGLAPRGLLELASSAGRMTMLTAEIQGETATPYAATWLGNPEAMAGHAGMPLGEGIRGAKWWAEAPVLSTHTALEVLRRDLTGKGLLIWGQDEVVELLADNNRITGVRIKSGETSLARHTILTAGALAGSLLRKVGPHLPLRPARTHLITLSEGDDVGFPMLVHRLRRGHLWMKRTREGPVMLAYDGLMDPTQATFSQKPDTRVVEALAAHAGQLVPALANAVVSQTSITTAAVTPDFRPALGGWNDVQGLWIATGFAARNYVFAAGAARLLGQLVKGEQTAVDIGPFNPERFMLGTWQRFAHPPSLNWKEPALSAQPQLVGGQKEVSHMNNVQMIEKPDAKFASNVKQIEKKVVTSAGSGKAPKEQPAGGGYFSNSKVKAASVGR